MATDHVHEQNDKIIMELGSARNLLKSRSY